jgi:hypothetical protein
VLHLEVRVAVKVRCLTGDFINVNEDESEKNKKFGHKDASF